MLVKCEKGLYHLVHNFRNAFDVNAFCDKYFEEVFDNDNYIVGDIAAGILRLKGFNNDPKSKNYYGFIDDYLEISCVIGSPYYILKRITEEEYEKLSNDKEASETDESGFLITPITKENFDKESLVLKSNPKQKPRINLDMNHINSIPKGRLPEDLKEDNGNTQSSNNKRDNRSVEAQKKAAEETLNTQTYVSSSNGFDPSKVQNRPRGFNNDYNKNNKEKNKNKNNNNNNNNNLNKNKNNNQNKNNSSENNPNQKNGNAYHNHNKNKNKKNFKPNSQETNKD